MLELPAIPGGCEGEQLCDSWKMVRNSGGLAGQGLLGKAHVPTAAAALSGMEVAGEPSLTAETLPQVCGKSFNRMYNLLGHMHLHAGSKPFKCPYCSSKFNLKGNLSRHMKVKHGVMDISLDSQGGCRLGTEVPPESSWLGHATAAPQASFGELRVRGHPRDVLLVLPARCGSTRCVPSQAPISHGKVPGGSWIKLNKLGTNTNK